MASLLLLQVEALQATGRGLQGEQPSHNPCHLRPKSLGAWGWEHKDAASRYALSAQLLPLTFDTFK